MKKILSFLLLLGVSASIFVACKRNDDGGAKSNVNTKHTARAYESTASLSVKCGGACDDATKTCGMIFDPKARTCECMCAGTCAMTLSDSYAAHADQWDKTLQLFTDDITQYFTAAQGAAPIVCDSITLDLYDSAKFLQIAYRDPATQEHKTVSFAAYYASNSLTQAITCDCHGTTCDCRERFIATTGSVECTCQGDCKMDITNKKIAGLTAALMAY